MKTTKSFSAQQMPLQPVFLEMEEEEEDVRKATASPAAGQPRRKAPAAASGVSPGWWFSRGNPYGSSPRVCCQWQQREEV